MRKGKFKICLFHELGRPKNVLNLGYIVKFDTQYGILLNMKVLKQSMVEKYSKISQNLTNKPKNLKNQALGV